MRTLKPKYLYLLAFIYVVFFYFYSNNITDTLIMTPIVFLVAFLIIKIKGSRVETLNIDIIDNHLSFKVTNDEFLKYQLSNTNDKQTIHNKLYEGLEDKMHLFKHWIADVKIHFESNTKLEKELLSFIDKNRQAI